MTKKKPKRAAKPRPLMDGPFVLAHVDEFKLPSGQIIRSVRIPSGEICSGGAEAFKAWLPGAIAWCEEGSVKR